MSEEKKVIEKQSQDLKEMMTLENIQKYILGYKDSGYPRAVYDIYCDIKYGKCKKKKRRKHDRGKYEFYFESSDRDKKKKHKKKNKKKKKNKGLDYEFEKWTSF